MKIKELKKELGLKDKDLAGFFGLKHRSYSESSAKKRYEQAFIKIYDFLEGRKFNKSTNTMKNEKICDCCGGNTGKMKAFKNSFICLDCLVKMDE